MRYFFYALLICLAFAGCRKNTIDTSCEDFREALVNDDIEAVRTIITSKISALALNNAHTAENLSRLAASIAGDCVETEIFCYACVDTLPAQSEIIITIFTLSGTIKRVIDISATSQANPTMRMLNMHS